MSKNLLPALIPGSYELMSIIYDNLKRELKSIPAAADVSIEYYDYKLLFLYTSKHRVSLSFDDAGFKVSVYSLIDGSRLYHNVKIRSLFIDKDGLLIQV